MSRMTTEELERARLELNTPDGFAISKAVVRELIDEVLELRAFAYGTRAYWECSVKCGWSATEDDDECEEGWSCPWCLRADRTGRIALIARTP